MAGFGVRWRRWRDVWVVVVQGDLDVDAAADLNRRISRLQRDRSVFVDLWDVTSLDPVVIGLLATAKRRANASGWDFAVIAKHGGAVHTEIEAAGLADALPCFPTKHDARAALRHG